MGFSRLDITYKFPPMPAPFKVEMSPLRELWYTMPMRSTTGPHDVKVHGGIACSTRLFCKKFRLSEEETMIWVLKYGDRLPYRLDQI